MSSFFGNILSVRCREESPITALPAGRDYRTIARNKPSLLPLNLRGGEVGLKKVLDFF